MLDQEETIESVVENQRPWIELEALAESGSAESIEAFLGTLSGTDAMRALLHLTADRQTEILSVLSPASAADILEEMPDAQAADLVESLEPEDAADILEEMAPEDQADLIADIDGESAQAIFSEMEPGMAKDVKELAEYDPESAGGLMTKGVFSFASDKTVRDVLASLASDDMDFDRYRGQHPYIIDDHNRLVGVVSLRQLLRTHRGSPLSEIMTDAISVGTDTRTEELAVLLDEHPFLGIPVVDDERRLIGTVSRAMVSEASAEKANIDHLRAQGIVEEELRSMPTSIRARRRLSWLSINIVLNILAASVIAFYEDTLTAVIALAVFLPIVSDMSGCSGNQAVAVSMRELALGLAKPIDVASVWLKEVSVGLINGLVLGLLLGCVAWVWKGNPFLGLVVGGALMMNTIIAVSIGGTVPLVLKRFGADPAVASGPILTTITDMIGFFLVLTLATAMMPYLVTT